MTCWEAAFIVLFEERGADWKSGPGIWMNYKDVAASILKRRLKETRAANFSQSVGKEMRKYGIPSGHVELQGYDTGDYRIKDYRFSIGFYEELMKSYGWHPGMRSSKGPKVLTPAPPIPQSTTLGLPPLKVTIKELPTNAPAKVGAGFGTPIENKRVEAAAVAEVKKLYVEAGWSVQSVESKKCGYDLDCHKGQLRENVEVKGVRGTKHRFQITAGEVRQAQTNPRFVLVVVTSALSQSPNPTKYSATEFCKRFQLTPLQFMAELEP